MLTWDSGWAFNQPATLVHVSFAGSLSALCLELALGCAEFHQAPSRVYSHLVGSLASELTAAGNSVNIGLANTVLVKLTERGGKFDAISCSLPTSRWEPQYPYTWSSLLSFPLQVLIQVSLLW